ncbi:MAG: kinase-like domain-containing protein [Benjaminiella poitrasii]|nr:MAG: kinase-like domain-containing protein [Benjaminiella poitrasii]
MVTPTITNKNLLVGAFIDDLRIVKILGKGAYGQIFLGQHQDTSLYAIKSLLHSNKNVLLERMEIGLHARITAHPNIIQLKRAIRDSQRGWTYIVLEYGPEGDLFSAITERNLYMGNHALIRHVFLQIIDAVSYCHEHNVYHRDLKPENILVFDGGYTVKLADFGLATTNTISYDYGCGSVFYQSPECCLADASQNKRNGYATAPNDVWALGVILVNLVTGRNPWKQANFNDEMFRSYLADPDFLLSILPISSEMNMILKRIFCIDPSKRISLSQLKREINNCTYFNIQKKETTQNDKLPPSPPATPFSNRARSPAIIHQQRIENAS